MRLFRSRRRREEELEEEIQSLSEFRAELRGKASQQSVLIALAVSAIGVFLSIISIVEKVTK